ncbi:hypothetical protein BYT27DRAFT_7244551 [Phlegmacium glaucopus]|nr:hypothetical protein BYT27DRAFT_7244551 [Phlegmacium glaucopus]
MFRRSKNIIIRGGTLVVVNGDYNMYPSYGVPQLIETMSVDAHQTPEIGEENDERRRPNPYVSNNNSQVLDTNQFIETMSVNAHQIPELEEENDKRGRLNPHWHVSNSQVLDTDQFSHRNPSWQENVQQFGEPGGYASPGYPSAVSFGTAVHAYGQIPEHSPYLMPTPSTPTPSDSSLAELEYGMHSNNRYGRRLTFPQPEHFQGGAWSASSSSHYPVRTSTYPMPTPSPPFSIPQIYSLHCFCELCNPLFGIDTGT